MGEKRLSAGLGKPSESVREAVIDVLRSRILSLERHAPRRGAWALAGQMPESGRPSVASQPEHQGLEREIGQGLGWRLGCRPVDALLPAGLEAGALHEIKGAPSTKEGASAADWMAGIGFAVRLAIRRIDALIDAEAGRERKARGERPWVLWCWPRSLSSEFGVPSAAGLLGLGLDPSRLVIVETPRASEALNAIEEGLRAESLAVVIGVLDEADLTPARRLSLAAAEMATPCLLVTHPASEPAAATATRWRVKRQPAGPHAFDLRAPGASRFSISLERCKARPESAAQPAVLVEWSDEARRFDLASVVADLPAETRRTGSSAIAAAVRPH